MPRLMSEDFSLIQPLDPSANKKDKKIIKANAFIAELNILIATANNQPGLCDKFQSLKIIHDSLNDVLKNNKFTPQINAHLTKWNISEELSYTVNALGGYDYILNIIKADNDLRKNMVFEDTDTKKKNWKEERYPSNIKEIVDNISYLAATINIEKSIGDRMARLEGLQYSLRQLEEETKAALVSIHLKLEKNTAEQLRKIHKWASMAGSLSSTLVNDPQCDNYQKDLIHNRNKVKNIADFFESMNSVIITNLAEANEPDKSLLPKEITIKKLGGNRNPVFHIEFNSAGKKEEATIRVYPLTCPEDFDKYIQRTDCTSAFNNTERKEVFNEFFGEFLVPNVAAFELVEYTPKGHLFKIVEDNKSKDSEYYNKEENILHIQQQTLYYLHKTLSLMKKLVGKGMLPTDIKPSNLFIRSVTDEDGNEIEEDVIMSDIKAILLKARFNRTDLEEMSKTYMKASITDKLPKKRGGEKQYTYDELEAEGLPHTAAAAAFELATAELPVGKGNFALPKPENFLFDTHPIYQGKPGTPEAIAGAALKEILQSLISDNPMTYKAAMNKIETTTEEIEAAIERMKNARVNISKKEKQTDNNSISKTERKSSHKGKTVVADLNNNNSSNFKGKQPMFVAPQTPPLIKRPKIKGMDNKLVDLSDVDLSGHATTGSLYNFIKRQESTNRFKEGEESRRRALTSSSERKRPLSDNPIVSPRNVLRSSKEIPSTVDSVISPRTLRASQEMLLKSKSKPDTKEKSSQKASPKESSSSSSSKKKKK